ncbi:GAF domain-containing protein [Cellulosimicrobium cellulans]|uniref:GAF domain-containing protein n=1 Tax=Cellulosimicrobium cellulans TaxID=1710 RepID=UPI0019668984|nr:GAF domain-containing protein [Cellulosimicrobium cellulans]MBN0039403.1 GAF domain-containing protein [Cellulosimicrobium cellulans]
MKTAWFALQLAAARWWWLAALSALLLTAAGFFVGTSWPVVVVLGVLGAAALVLDASSKRTVTRLAQHVATEWKVLFEDCFQPLARCLLRLAVKTTEGAKKEELVSALMAVLTAALSLTEGSRARATLFRRVRVEGQDCLEPHPMFTHGRGDEPVSRFFRRRGEGKEVWRAAEADETVFYPDIRKDPPPGMDADRPRAYVAFITTPIVVNGRVEGLLTINATRVDELSESDRGVMRVLGVLAGVALATSGGRWPQDEGD